MDYLSALSYHRKLKSHYEAEEPELWSWFASTEKRRDSAEHARLDLLKTTYRLDRSAETELYSVVDAVAEKLEISQPITLYQAQDPKGMNAGLVFVPDELHIVLEGPVLTSLDEAELRAVLGHEMTHFLFYHLGEGEYRITGDLVSAQTYDPDADYPYCEAARLFFLYTEILCDRGGFAATGSVDPAISSLVKIQTGLTSVSADSYRAQAEEIFSGGSAPTEGITHPESFIRTRSLALWAEKGDAAQEEIERMISGPPVLQRLDLLRQKEMSERTRRLVARFLAPAWMRTESVVAHARLFFESFTPEETSADDDQELLSSLRTDDKELRDYYCYVLLDFAAADRDLEQAPLAAAILLAREFGADERLAELARKELRLRKKEMEKLFKRAEEIVTQANGERA